MKMTFGREFYIPTNSTEHKTESGAVYYTYTTTSGKPAAMGFGGKRNKPDFHYTFRNEQRREEHILGWLDGLRKTQEMKAKWRADRQAGRCSTPLECWEKARRGEHLTAPDVAVCLRAVLARKFPGVKFSVRSDSGLNVSWTDGPTDREVRQISNCYSFQGFDGMIDMRYSISRWLSRDGTMSLAHSEGTTGSAGVHDESEGDPHSADSVLVHAHCDFVFTSRELSEVKKRQLLASVARKFGFQVPENIENLDRYFNCTQVCGEYLSTLIHREGHGAND